MEYAVGRFICRREISANCLQKRVYTHARHKVLFLSPFNFSPGFPDGKISAFFPIYAFVFSRFKSVYALFGFFRFFVFKLQFLPAPPAARNLAGTLVLFDFRFFCPACFTRILLKALWRKSEGRKPRWCQRWKKPRGFLFSVSAFQFRFL